MDPFDVPRFVRSTTSITFALWSFRRIHCPLLLSFLLYHESPIFNIKQHECPEIIMGESPLSLIRNRSPVYARFGRSSGSFLAIVTCPVDRSGHAPFSLLLPLCTYLPECTFDCGDVAENPFHMELKHPNANAL